MGYEADAMSENIGQQGRIAVIGGSEDYTGAPYFSAMASARLGCDMVCLFSPPASSYLRHGLGAAFEG